MTTLRLRKTAARKTAASKIHVVHVAGRGNLRCKASTTMNLSSQMMRRMSSLKKVKPPGVEQDSGFVIGMPTEAISEDPPTPFTLMNSKMKKTVAMIFRSWTQIYQELSVVAPSCAAVA
jgi:hypothetical protein